MRAIVREQSPDITIGAGSDRSAAARIARDLLFSSDAPAMVGEEMLRSARPGLMKSEAARDGCGVISQSRLGSPFRLTACVSWNGCDHDFDSSRAGATAAPRRRQRL